MRSNWPACVLLTGASGEIGRALALEYAAPGVRLILQGRRLGRLDELVGLCRERGATLSVAAFDIRATERLLAWLEEVNATHRPTWPSSTRTSISTSGPIAPASAGKTCAW